MLQVYAVRLGVQALWKSNCTTTELWRDLTAIGVRVSRPLANPNNDELGRSKRRNADFNNQPPVVDVILCHRSLIATDEERFVRWGTM